MSHQNELSNTDSFNQVRERGKAIISRVKQEFDKPGLVLTSERTRPKVIKRVKDLVDSDQATLTIADRVLLLQYVRDGVLGTEDPDLRLDRLCSLSTAAITQNTGTEPVEPTRKSFLLLLKIAGLILIYIVLHVCYGAHVASDRFAHAHVERWKAVDGTIVKSDKERIKDRSTSGYNKYTVEYTYTVDGHSYSSNKFSFPSNTFSSGNWQMRDPHLERGDHVTVWYDPMDPADSVLKKAQE
jgi:hypothetical protein